MFRGKELTRLVAILLVALNLRGAITCVGPLLADIQARFGLNGTAAGLLTSLPLFAFGFLSPYAAPVARRLGIEQAIFISMLVLLGGLGLRYLDSTPMLYLGTALIGCGIAFNNVLLPGLLHRDFANRLTMVTALFTIVIVTSGGTGSGIAIPLAELGGWRFSLLSWAIPAVLAVLVWLPQLRAHSRPADSARPEKPGAVWNQPLAWQVSMFMACQSTAFYVMISWFPTIIYDLEGISAARAGVMLSVYQLFVLGSVMITPVFIHRMPDQRLIGPVLASLILAAFTGLFFAPHHAMAWMVVMGLGAGGSLVLSMTLFGLRASSPMQSVALSGMAQAVAYTMSAVTPIVIGMIHDLTHAWALPLLLMMVCTSVQVTMGYFAGRPLKLPASAAQQA